MSTTPTETRPAGGGALERLAGRPERVTYALLAVAAALAGVAVWLFATRSFAVTWPLNIAALAASAATLTVALLRFGGLAPAEQMRLRLLAFGGSFGAIAALLGFLLPFTIYKGVFTGGLKEWRANPAALTWTGLALFGGLTLMFASLQLARGAERSSPALRRLLYGYNAVLGGILLVAVLGLLNVAAYTRAGPFDYVTRTYDWTTEGFYTLSDTSKKLLTSLDKPLTVYVFLSRRDLASHDVEALLEACRSVTNKFTWQSISRDRNRTDFGELVRKYQISEPYGLLVVYGPEGGENAPRPAYDFIKGDDLFTLPSSSPFMPDPSGGKYVFKGENALMKTIRYLTEGKTRAVIYFTKGNGELTDEGGRRGAGMSRLRGVIAKGNYEVKDLDLGVGGETAVPADADVVVVARPGGNGLPMSESAVKALRDYLQGTAGKKGKLMVLMDVIKGPDGTMLKTGLEGLLRDYRVQVGDDRVLVASSDPPTGLRAIANPQSSNPVAQAMFTDEGTLFFYFEDARTVEPAGGDTPGAPYSAETLIEVLPQMAVWVEKDLSVSPSAKAAMLRKPENREALLKTISRKPVSIAVAVTERKGSQPAMPPGHPPVGGESSPRMIVFGDATWASDQVDQSRTGQMLEPNNVELFLNCLTWLRERPDIGRQAPDKEHKMYRLTASDEAVDRLALLPATLLLLCVITLAGGVWLVRRR